MTVIITMAGLGSRFRQAGYSVPKYRITARGRTLMDWSLLSMQAFFGERFVFACLEEEDTNWILGAAETLGIADVVIAARPALSCGQAETAFDALSHANPNEPLWIYNIDTYVTPMEMRPSDLNGADGCLHVFNSTDSNMSFVKYGEEGQVVDIAEKRPISRWATVGLYGFRSAAGFDMLYSESYYAGRVPTVNGEHYVAPMYELMLKRGERIVAPRLRSEDVHILGTPAQVQALDPAAVPPFGSGPEPR
jgi:dTDP-glucose pyrophosphorylase